MKHLLVALALCSVSFLSTSLLSAQSKSLPSNNFIFSAGIGAVPTYLSDAPNRNLPPINIKAGYQFSKRIVVNAFAGYSSSKSTPTIFADGFQTYFTNKSFVLGARGEIHQKFNYSLDFYGGAMLGVNFVDLKEINAGTGKEMERIDGQPTPYDPNPNTKQLMYSAFIGANYFFVKGVGLFGEIGYGVSLLNFGLTFKL